ncbi:MAG TPA: AMP-binding protein [Phycisphaerales bacterium]|nr:AMP-binding protein [Phycisphaerales bacterium]
MSIHWPIIKRLIRSPRRVVMIDDRRSYRAFEVLVGAMHVADVIRARCQTRTVGLLIPTSGAFPMAALAGWMAGKTVVPINYLLKPEEMNYIVRDCGCDTVITAQAMLDFLGSNVDACVFAPEGGGGGPPTAMKNLVRLEDIDFKGVPGFEWPSGAADDDLAVLLYTSGTSGKPKGVMLSHGNIEANIAQIRAWVRLEPGEGGDVVFGVLPQFHTFGLTVLSLLPLTAGLRAVYTARFVPARIMKLIREHRPTMMVAIPSMYNALLHAKDAAPEDFYSLRYIVSGGEPLPRAVFDAFREKFGVTIAEGYGLTETSPVTNWCRPEEWRLGTVGRALPGIDQRIVEIAEVPSAECRVPGGGGVSSAKCRVPSWREAPVGHEGEIRMRGPNVMRGYFHLPEETARAFDERGYFRTGDIGRVDEDGFLYITGRLKEMLIIGGENVFPREIEEVLNAHPSVKESGVVGKPDPMRGEVPVAFVELAEGAGDGPQGTGVEKALRSWCRTRLAGYKVPDEFRVVGALPRNPTGKVVRRELNKMLAAAEPRASDGSGV